MNTAHFLQRIFALARRTPDRSEIDLPFGLETAVLAQWKAAVQHRVANGGLLRVLRWGALVACAVAVIVAVESDELIAFKNRFDPEARVADSAVASYDYE